MARIVLVTGCTKGGIGDALCRVFAQQGCKVYASARRVESLQEYEGLDVVKIALDVTSDESVKRAVDEIIEREGRLDVLVNNAGMIAPGPIVEYDLSDAKTVFETNTFAILRLSQAVVPFMAKARSGTIVNIGSIVGELATPWNGIYCTSKAAVHSISETMSMELRPFGISVVHVAPGAVRSNLSSNAGKRFSLAPNSLFREYLGNIIVRMNSSQGPGSMATDDFAEQVVDKVLGKNPPRYISLGGTVMLFRLLKWLPRGLALGILWKRFSQKTD